MPHPQFFLQSGSVKLLPGRHNNKEKAGLLLVTQKNTFSYLSAKSLINLLAFLHGLHHIVLYPLVRNMQLVQKREHFVFCRVGPFRRRSGADLTYIYHPCLLLVRILLF